MLRTLIAAPSVSCTAPELDQSNLAVVSHLAAWLEDLGFQAEVVPLPDRPQKANLIATLSPAGGGASEDALVLAGHTDTVPFDAESWQHDPFELTSEDDKLYGLGSCDMKGFFPVALSAIARVDRSKLTRPVVVVATADEESTMAGARHLADSGRPRARAAVIGEPTSGQPIYAHKGIMFQSIALHGASGHSSDPARGKSALDAMAEVMAEIVRFRDELTARHENKAFEVTVPTLNLGCLKAGDNPNRICEHAELQIDMRLLPGMSYDDTLAALAARLEPIAKRHGTDLAMATFYPPIPPYETALDGELVQTLERLSGRRAGTVAFGTEAPFFAALGMETVVFGPGSINQAHQPDEFLHQAQIAPMTDALTALINQYCVSR